MHSSELTNEELIEIDGVLLTSVARTVFDVACAVPFDQGVVVADAALHCTSLTLDQLDAQLARCGRRMGCGKARAMIEFADGRSEGVGESRSRVGMLRAGLPAPELQHTVWRADGTKAGTTDFRWGNLVGEFDGMIKYGRLLRPGETSGVVIVREKIREDEIRDLGRRMVRWIWREFDRPNILWGRVGEAVQRWS